MGVVYIFNVRLFCLPSNYRKKENYMTNNDLKEIENVIGYEFHNKDLLQQAFIRKSYSEENGGENNEVLEFIGDKALDFAIVKLLMDNYGWYAEDADEYDSYEDENEFITDYTEGEFTNLKKKLVEKKMLAHRIDILGLNQYLIMGNGDINKNAQDEPSVKEDLFEAIIGAVTLDCGWNLEKIESTVDLMLEPDYYLDNDFEEDDNYVDLVQQWSQKEYHCLPTYEYFDTYYNDSNYQCTLTLEGIHYYFTGYGYTKSEARMEAAQKAYEYLEKTDLLFTIKDEIYDPCEELAINQLQELAQKGYFSMPEYEFEETYDEDGYPVWECSCKIYEESNYWTCTRSTKREAKKAAAWCMLKQVLEIEED